METISWEDRDGARWIALEGELDHEGCLVVRDRFQEAVTEGEEDIVVVLEGVTFLSSMAVGMLLKAREVLQKQQRALKLTGITPNLRRVFDMMNLSDVFDEI